MTGKSSSVYRPVSFDVDKFYNLDVRKWTAHSPKINDDSIALVAFAPHYSYSDDADNDWIEPLECVLTQSQRILGPGCHLAVICAGLGQAPFKRTHHRIAEMIEALPDMSLRGEIIWSKVPLYSNRYLYGSWRQPRAPGIVGAHETIYIARKHGTRKYMGTENLELEMIPLKRFRELTQSVWSYGVDSRNRQYHPNCLPVSLGKALIELFTWPSEIVVDPYCGIGSIPRAAVELGRHFIGMDIDRKYLTVAEQRVYPYIKGKDWI